MIEVEIYPDRQRLTKDEVRTITNTLAFLCKKAGWGINIKVHAKQSYGGQWPPP